ncbi:MAG: hypothetical protein KDA22_00980 [Phycisphaerales bacterium]|nr:hypothetical protein [Phycisphaerales bacterium]
MPGAPFRIAFVLLLALSAPARAGERSDRTMVIVHSAALTSAAESWSAYRVSDGWTVVRIPIDAGAAPEAIRTRIRACLRRARSNEPASSDAPHETAILLLGDADAIPPFPFEQPDPRLVTPGTEASFISDHPYRLADDRDEVPDWSLGRVPARSNDEAESVLAKVRQYEQEAPPGAWRARLAFVAGEGRFGAADQLLETLFRAMVETMLPPSSDLSMIYASPASSYCPPPSQLEDAVVSRLGEDNLLFVYLGHGSPHALDRLRIGRAAFPILGRGAVARLDTPRAGLPIAFLGCCSTGWFDEPSGKPCLAESMLLTPGGPAAVIAGSRPTHPYGTAVLQKNLTRILLEVQPPTVGELDRLIDAAMLHRSAADLVLDGAAAPVAAAMHWPVGLSGLRLMHVRMYNLLGDPAMRIAYPRARVTELSIRDGVLRGVVHGIDEGTARVTVETRRDDCVRPDALEAVLGADDPELERKARSNFETMADRTLAVTSAAVRNGAFEARLPRPMPERAAIVRVVIESTGPPAARREAIGGLRLPAPGTGRDRREPTRPLTQ